MKLLLSKEKRAKRLYNYLKNRGKDDLYINKIICQRFGNANVDCTHCLVSWSCDSNNL